MSCCREPDSGVAAGDEVSLPRQVLELLNLPVRDLWCLRHVWIALCGGGGRVSVSAWSRTSLDEVRARGGFCGSPALAGRSARDAVPHHVCLLYTSPSPRDGL